MTEDRAPYDAPDTVACSHDAERRMWLAIRRGLLVIARAIEVRWGKDDREERHPVRIP